MRLRPVTAGTRVRGRVVFRDGLEVEREALGRPSWRIDMTKAVQKITLSPSRDIPFNKLVLSQSNVRHVKAGISIEQLAESIAHRTLLQSLVCGRLFVRTVASGVEVLSKVLDPCPITRISEREAA